MARKKEIVSDEVIGEQEVFAAEELKKEPVQPKFIMKGSQSFVHSLFKSDVQLLKKNTSYKKFQPMIEELEHSHIYHSHDSKGNAMDKCHSVGGHYHRIEMTLGADGMPAVVCSGPKHMVDEVHPRTKKMRKVEQDVVFFDDRGNETKEIHDTHVHQFKYVHSEELSANSLAAASERDRARLQAMVAQAKK